MVLGTDNENIIVLISRGKTRVKRQMHRVQNFHGTNSVLCGHNQFNVCQTKTYIPIF